MQVRCIALPCFLMSSGETPRRRWACDHPGRTLVGLEVVSYVAGCRIPSLDVRAEPSCAAKMHSNYFKGGKALARAPTKRCMRKRFK